LAVADADEWAGGSIVKIATFAKSPLQKKRLCESCFQLFILLESILKIFLRMQLFYAIFFSILSFPSLAQSDMSIDVKAILKTAFTDEKYRSNQALSQHAAGLNYQMPLLQKSELRLGADDNQSTQNQIGLNLFFNSYRAIQEQYRWKQSRVASISTQDPWFLQDALATRYKCIIEIYFADQSVRYYRHLDTLLDKENELFQASIVRGAEIEMKEVFRNETDKHEVSNALLATDRNRQSAYRNLQSWTGKTIQSIDFKDFISIDSLQKTLESLPIGDNHPEIIARNGQLALYDANLKLDKIEKSKILSSVQMGMQREFRNNDWLISPFARLTFNIPILGNYRKDWHELDLRRREVENRIRVLRVESLKNIETHRLNLQNLLKQHTFLAKKQQNNAVERLLNNPKVAAEMPVNDLIRIQVIQQKNALTRLKVSEDMVKTYLEILIESGQLSMPPLRDYLHRSLEVF
jgi:hypothetical protein